MPKNDLLCLAQLRWAFTYQRPNHLMARFARERRVFYLEEPIYVDGGPARIVGHEQLPNLTVLVPHVPRGTGAEELGEVLRDVLQRHGCIDPVQWVYTPMMLPLLRGLPRSVVVYDCMDELSMFRNAPPEMKQRETELLEAADLVFTGGHSLYEAKRALHPRVYAFPSSVDVDHFRLPRGATPPGDQRDVPRPRVGFFGVIDERMDIDLLTHVARERPQYQFVLVGPVVKISPQELPKAPNLHYLGAKQYDELPDYLAGWDVAFMPFALNDATRFISPTKTLEFLAAGKPVVSTAVRDVVRPYGEQGIVSIAGKTDFAGALDEALAGWSAQQSQRVTQMLGNTSWDATWAAMAGLVEEAEAARSRNEEL